MYVAEDRARWRAIGEAYRQQWTVVMMVMVMMMMMMVMMVVVVVVMVMYDVCMMMCVSFCKFVQKCSNIHTYHSRFISEGVDEVS
jgi:hypothetical protein